jgi:UDP-2,3-diacylglucosamine pyrophosphatase LpxH
MLALISDLHFCDGTAIPGNVAPEAFALALGEIYDLARQIAEARNRPTRVDLVLLGDIFDLLRTERWFQDRAGNPVPLEERPWASPEALTRQGGATPQAIARAREILAEILEKNADSLAVVRGEIEPPPQGVEVRRIYVPGNHDRLYLHDEGLRAAILANLGAVDGRNAKDPGIGMHRLSLPEYGTVARHGHEWDVWNFPEYRSGATPEQYTDEDYLPTPIGDPITTEFAVALPYELRLRLLESRLFPPPLANRVHERMKRIQDVRPLLASFRWAYYAIERVSTDLDREQSRVLRAALDDTLRTLARRFRQLEFYKAWYEEKHDPLCLDTPLLVRLLLAAVSAPWFPARQVAEIAERGMVWRGPTDSARRGARREDLARVGEREMRFVVYGHTHGAAHVPLHGTGEVQDVYLNTGTYRPGVFRADDGRGFVGWQRISYTCISSAEEAVFTQGPFGGRNVGPAFVSWIGGRSAGSVSRTGGSLIRSTSER